MLAVLGIDPFDPHWAADGADESLHAATDTLVRRLLADRTAARAAKDFAAADAIRDQLTAAGIVVTDTPDGPSWSLSTT
jgi:cysteinyl-tRNA synthetase